MIPIIWISDLILRIWISESDPENRYHGDLDSGPVWIIDLPLRFTGISTAEYETDSFERIQSSPSLLAGDPDPVQSGLVDQKPIQSNPIRLVQTVHIFVHCVGKVYTYTSFANFLHEYVGRLRSPKSSKTLYDF